MYQPVSYLLFCGSRNGGGNEKKERFKCLLNKLKGEKTNIDFLLELLENKRKES